jgi:hypothetical protein
MKLPNRVESNSIVQESGIDEIVADFVSDLP